MSCPICSAQATELMRLYDDRYGHPGVFPLFRCAACGHAFLVGTFTPDMLEVLYSTYYPRSSFDLQSFRPHRERSGFAAWLDGAMADTFRWVPRNVRVLDIGCGFGESLAYHRARGCDVAGVEADGNIRRVAEKFGFNVHVGLFDASVYPADHFDYVTMSQVIEHVVDPVDTLGGVARILKPGGVAVLSTPNASGWGARVFGTRWINWHAPYHLHFFTAESMRRAAERAGLVIEKSVTRTPSAWLHFQWIHLLTRPPEGRPSAFWAPHGKLSRAQKFALGLLTLVHRSKINHLVTRLFDAMGWGDSRVYVLRKP